MRLISKELKKEIVRKINFKEIYFKNLRHFLDEAGYKLLREDTLKKCTKSFVKTYKKAYKFTMQVCKKSINVQKKKSVKRLYNSGYYNWRGYSIRHFNPFFAFNSTIKFYEDYLELKKNKKDIITIFDTKDRIHWTIQILCRDNKIVN